MRIISRKDLRKSRRGAAMAVSMAMFIIVTVAGTGFLATNWQYTMQTMSKGIDMRLYNAAEAGMETVRGRFTLIIGAQENWDALFDAGDPLNTWNVVDTRSINGATVVTSAKALAVGSVPKARLRAVATIAGRQRAVEQDIKISTFSDYALFYNLTGTLTLGANFTCWGPLMCRGNIDCNGNTGIEFHGDVKAGLDILNEGGSPLYAYGRETNATIPPINPETVALDVPKNQAIATNTRFYQNTFEIVFNENGTFTRRYWRRQGTAASPTTPPAAVSPANPENDATLTSTNDDFELYNNDTGVPLPVYSGGVGTRWPASGGTIFYVVASETLPIPNEGVIYIDSDMPSVAGGTLLGGVYYCVDSAINTNNLAQCLNNYRQPIMDTSTNGGDNDCPSGNAKNDGSWGAGSSAFKNFPVVLVKGTLHNVRVTLAAEGNVIVSDCIRYKTLLDNPSLRLADNKKSAAATNYTEMLGICSQARVWLRTRWWTALPTASRVGPVDNVTHYENQFCTDGTYFGRDRVRIAPGGELSSGNTSPQNAGWSNTEYWVCGGLLNGGELQSSMGSFTRRNYDWDYRLASTTPPYFLRTYNVPAARIAQTWRTYTP